ncbi:MAG: ACP S-malonyltransferase [Thermodesulfobacteriota bacterium]|nr:MAG: ACP S-malonyltransferase [Thermodesulfobacteriota bacterium]
MKKYAFIFPGQGSQYVGMGRSFFEGFDSAKKTFEEGGDVLGFDLESVVFEGPKEDLDMTEKTQPALLVASIAALRVLSELVDLKPDFYAGHSLGEYTALVAAGALGFKDAVRLVHLRGKFMQEAAGAGIGKMSAILGLSPEEVTGICEEASKDGSVVVPANINSPAQVVVSGHSEAVERAGEIAKKKGARRVVPLSVSAPSHSPLMAVAAERFARELEEMVFSGLSAPVITNVDAKPIKDPSSIADALTRQLTCPVRWVEVIEMMRDQGVGMVVEIGPGKVLSGLVKRIDREMETSNLDTAGDLESVAGLFSGATI